MLKNIKEIEGKQTLETISSKLNLTKNSAANLVSKLKKEGHLTSSVGSNRKRIYTISLKNKPLLGKGMFDILSEKTPIKITAPFEHKIIGNYRIEDAIVDLIRLDDIRILKGIVYLFNYVSDWSYLKQKAKGVEAKLGALYDFARNVRKTKKMPEKTRKALLRHKPKNMTRWILDKNPDKIAKEWNITIPLGGEEFDKH